MTDLQTAFYIIAIVYMGLMFILFIMLLTAILVIKSKINAAHRMIDEKIASAKAVASKADIFVRTVRYFVKR